MRAAKDRVAAKIEAGPNRLVSIPKPGKSRNEPWVAASRVDPDRFVATFHLIDDERSGLDELLGAETMVTSDGGATWRQAPLTDEHGFDPTVVAGPEGQFYVTNCAWGPPKPELGAWHQGKPQIRQYTSLDDGDTWSEPAFLRVPCRPDHQRMAVDCTGGRFHGRVYTSWVEMWKELYVQFPSQVTPAPYHMVLNYTEADGTTQGKPVVVHTTAEGRPATLEPIVFSDGTLLLPFFYQPLVTFGHAGFLDPKDEYFPAFVVRSTDGGETFEPVVEVVEVGQPVWATHRHRFWGIPNFPIFIGDTSPNSPFCDRAYAVWNDKRAGSTTDIWLIHSTDKGRTWSEPVRVNDFADPLREGGPPDLRLLATVAVNKDGVVGISWYDRRDDPTRRAWKLYFTASLDGGETFLPNVAISTAPSPPGANKAPSVEVYRETGEELPSWDEIRRVGATIEGDVFAEEAWEYVAAKAKARIRLDAGLTATSRLHVAFDSGRALHPGDYSGLAAAADGSFMAVWADRRRGNQEVYCARVRVITGPTDEPTLEDGVVNDAVEVIVDDVSFDEAAGVVTMHVQLANRSDRPIYAPISVKARNAVDGNPNVADEQEWSFSNLLGIQNRLDPGMISEPRTVQLPASAEHGLDLLLDYEVIGRQPAE